MLRACSEISLRGKPHILRIAIPLSLPTKAVLFSAPEPKAQVHYCDHRLSVVRRLSVRPSSVRPSSVVNFSHFQLLLWNRWTESNETWQKARSQRPLPSLCFSSRSEKQDGRPCLWFADIFLTSPLKLLNGIQPNLTGSKISTSSAKFVFFGPIGKTRWPPLPLIGWYIFDFSSETAERNSMKLDREQDLNFLYQVCVFLADRKNKMAAWPLIGWDIFDFSSETAERNSMKLDRKQDLNFLYQVCAFWAEQKTKMAALADSSKRWHITQVHDIWPFGPLVDLPCHPVNYFMFILFHRCPQFF